MAEAAVRMLLKKIHSKSFTVVQHVELNPELIVRESTSEVRPLSRRAQRKVNRR